MAAYNASTVIWSTCNSGGMPADGDEITVCNEHLYMDENANPAHTFTVIVRTELDFNLAGWDIAADVTLDDLGVGVYLAAGTLTGTLESSTPGVIADLGVGGAVTGGVNMDGNSCTWAGTGSLDCTTIAGTLNLGGAATGLAATVSADTTLATDLTCLSFDHAVGTLTLTGTPVITVGAGGFNYAGAFSGTYELVFSATTSVARTPSHTYTTKITVNAGVVATTSGTVTTVKLGGSGTLSIGANTLSLRWGATAGALADWTGDVISTSGYVNVYLGSGVNGAPGGSLSTTGPMRIYCAGASNRSCNWIGNISANNLFIGNGLTAALMTITHTGKLALTGDLTIGGVGVGDAGGVVLETSGIVCIAGAVGQGHANNVGNALHLGSTYVECGGAFDGDNLTVTDTSGTCHIMGLGTGTLQNVATDNLILAHDFATYGANTNVGQDTHAAPGSMALCGVGY